MNTDVRWKQRFQNYDRSVLLIMEPINRGIETLSNLEKEGTVQRFEIAVELAWKTMKDYLEYNGVVINPLTPRNVVKAAFSAKIIANGQVWIDMLDHRNLLSHTYNEVTFSKFLVTLQDRYLAEHEALRLWFAERITEE